jgi:hypothetical protein
LTETIWIDEATRNLLGRQIKSTSRGVLQRLVRTSAVGEPISR